MVVAPELRSELTLRAVLAGLVVGGLVVVSNVSIGLKLGLTFGTTVSAAVLPFVLFRGLRRWLRRPFDPRETLIASTAGFSALVPVTTWPSTRPVAHRSV